MSKLRSPSSNPRSQETCVERIVWGVKHVEHEIRRSLKDFVTHFALFIPVLVGHRHQAGNLLFLGGQLDFRHQAHRPPRREQPIPVDAQRQVRQQRRLMHAKLSHVVAPMVQHTRVEKQFQGCS